MTHDDLRKLTLIEASKISGVRLFPNPIGMATAGKMVKRFTENGKTYAIIENPRTIKFGLAEGTSDLIGWKTENGIARFLGVEIKVGADQLRPEQKNWIDTVKRFGGLAGVVKDSVDTLRSILD